MRLAGWLWTLQPRRQWLLMLHFLCRLYFATACPQCAALLLRQSLLRLPRCSHSHHLPPPSLVQPMDRRAALTLSLRHPCQHQHLSRMCCRLPRATMQTQALPAQARCRLSLRHASPSRCAPMPITTRCTPTRAASTAASPRRARLTRAGTWRAPLSLWRLKLSWMLSPGAPSLPALA